jgi:hypothetical protein
VWHLVEHVVVVVVVAVVVHRHRHPLPSPLQGRRGGTPDLQSTRQTSQRGVGALR